MKAVLNASQVREFQHGHVDDGAATERNTGIVLAVGILALAFLAGGLVVFILTPRPTTPPPALHQRL